MPSSSATVTTLLGPFRSRFCITTLSTIVGVVLSDSSSIFEASNILFGALTIVPPAILLIIFAIALLVIIPSCRLPLLTITHLLRFLHQRQVFGNLIRELTRMVRRRFPNSSPLGRNSMRTWIFIASKCIYRCTGDVISGSLACVTLISFLISYDETPIYVFIIWAICVISYLKNNTATILDQNHVDSNSTANSDSTTVSSPNSDSNTVSS